MIRPIAVLTLATLAAACAAPTMTFEEARAMCQERARAAAGPTGTASVGFNSVTGPQAGFSISVSDSFLRGDDPQVVYDTCMTDLIAAGRISGGAS